MIWDLTKERVTALLALSPAAPGRVARMRAWVRERWGSPAAAARSAEGDAPSLPQPAADAPAPLPEPPTHAPVAAHPCPHCGAALRSQQAQAQAAAVRYGGCAQCKRTNGVAVR